MTLSPHGRAVPSSEAPAPSTTPAVSVIVPHYNDIENLKICLDLLDRQTFPRETFEIVVADNNSRCGLAAVATVCGARARAVAAPVQGAGEARNAAVAASRGAVLAFIDSDCRPEPDWLARGVEALEQADVVGGPVIVEVEDPAHPTPVEAFELAFSFDTRRYVVDHHYCVTANMFTPREVFDRVGPFRGRVAEDVDWGWRATRLGFTLAYAPQAAIHHPARRTWDELIRKWRRTTPEMFYLTTELPGGRLKWAARTWALLISPVSGLVEVAASAKLRSFRERLDAYGVLVRLRAWRFVENNRLLLTR
ncbi:glycosyl transferase family 2 [Roseiarcus fermentans]|uniref:Glycosyl transferase family 2 n=1 Tax=Roseiarcus fermentans TaxID=1473586 RepID=A0A366EP59_9HYPH|nr:glycosyltransferase [Roseiarcus fermentans]RBP04168.1 glycosyl transferase family 2 [Roseiarcus fermentans]